MVPAAEVRRWRGLLGGAGGPLGVREVQGARGRTDPHCPPPHLSFQKILLSPPLCSATDRGRAFAPQHPLADVRDWGACPGTTGSPPVSPRP